MFFILEGSGSVRIGAETSSGAQRRRDRLPAGRTGDGAPDHQHRHVRTEVPRRQHAGDAGNLRLSGLREIPRHRTPAQRRRQRVRLPPHRPTPNRPSTTGTANDVFARTDRQPRRNRLPHHPHLPAPRHPDDRRVLGSRRDRAARAARRCRLSDRRPASGRFVPARRRDRRSRAAKPARRRSIRATDSCPRTPISPRRSNAPASPSSVRPPIRCARWDRRPAPRI